MNKSRPTTTSELNYFWFTRFCYYFCHRYQTKVWYFLSVFIVHEVGYHFSLPPDIRNSFSVEELIKQTIVDQKAGVSVSLWMKSDIICLFPISYNIFFLKSWSSKLLTIKELESSTAGFAYNSLCRRARYTDYLLHKCKTWIFYQIFWRIPNLFLQRPAFHSNTICWLHFVL